MKKLILFISLILVLTLSGCKPEPGSVSLPKSSEKPEYIPAEGGSLNLYALRTQNFNPISATSESVIESMWLIFEPLVTLDQNLNVVPVLIKDYSISDNAMIFTLNLKQGVKWHDGTEFTAEDAVFSLKAAMNANNSSVYKSRLDNVYDIKSINSSAIEIKLSKPVAGFMSNLNIPMVKKSNLGLYVIDTKEELVGTGKYQCSAFDLQKGLELTINQSWHGGKKPYIPRINIALLPEAALVQTTYNANNIDVVKASQADYGNYMSKSNSRAEFFPSNVYGFIGINFENELLQKPVIRKLISLAADRDKMAEIIFAGGGAAAKTPVNPASKFYSIYEDEDIKALTETEGFTIESTSMSYIGKKLSFTLIVNEESKTKVTASEYVAAAMLETGIEIKVKKLSFEKYLEALANKSYDLYFAEINLEADGDLGFLLKTGASQNIGGYSSDRMNTAVDDVNKKTGDERQRAYAAMQQIFIEELPHIPMYFKKNCIVYDSQRVRLPEISDITGIYSDIDNWYVPSLPKKTSDKKD